MVIGITGGVGCGKTTVLEYINKKYEAYVIEADKVAHKLMEPGTITYGRICKAFGSDILDEKGAIDRKRLGNIVFCKPEALKLLNSIVHPDVKKYIIDIIRENKYEFILLEAALLIEAGYMDICDELWYIYTDDKTRIKRLMESRGYSEEKAISIIKNQLSQEEFEKHCDIKLDNSLSFQNTMKQIDKILSQRKD